MTCSCPAPERASGWTPVPELRRATEVLPEENIDCFARRAGNQSGQQDDADVQPYGTQPSAPGDPPDKRGRITNTTIPVDALGQVSEVFELSESDPPEPLPITWTASGLPTGLTMSSSGQLTGTMLSADSGKTFKVMVRANNGASAQVDAREFTLLFKLDPEGQDDSISFVNPYKAADGSTPLINSGFGIRNHPITGVQKLHSGVDLVSSVAASKGQGTIVAAADGEVTFAGTSGGYGLLIKLNHFDSKGTLLCETRYAHCAEVLVQRGQKVAAGQAIAREGSTGASTGPHLHFELRLGGTQPADPLPYLRGEVQVRPPKKLDGTYPPNVLYVNGQSSAAPPKPIPPTNRAEVAGVSRELTNARAGSGCPAELPNQAPPTTPLNPEPPAAPTPAAPTPEFNDVMAAIDAAIADHNAAVGPSQQLAADDVKFLKFVAQIESRYDPAAKNPTSSATGLYQMLDKTAATYYAQLGRAPTLENRTDPYLATRAQALFYVNELRPYFEGFINSGYTTLAGKPLDPALQVKYAQLTPGEFMYGLVHHDGVGNAVRGVDRQGVDYFRRRVREQTFA
jgi:hypothetical protein